MRKKNKQTKHTHTHTQFCINVLWLDALIYCHTYLCHTCLPDAWPVSNRCISDTRPKRRHVGAEQKLCCLVSSGLLTLPVLLFANVQPLYNNMDDMQAQIRHTVNDLCECSGVSAVSEPGKTGSNKHSPRCWPSVVRLSPQPFNGQHGSNTCKPHCNTWTAADGMLQSFSEIIFLLPTLSTRASWIRSCRTLASWLPPATGTWISLLKDHRW